MKTGLLQQDGNAGPDLDLWRRELVEYRLTTYALTLRRREAAERRPHDGPKPALVRVHLKLKYSIGQTSSEGKRQAPFSFPQTRGREKVNKREPRESYRQTAERTKRENKNKVENEQSCEADSRVTTTELSGSSRREQTQEERRVDRRG
uniref:Uncharacterized protein n=1 Tax=Bracon brevicornis TaxID=1563983 RepID=A0A6V7INI6_9HYME